MSAQKKVETVNGRPVWADVSLSALTHNLHAIRDFVNPKSEKRSTPRKVLCIVKGNGYGHCGPQVAKALEKAGADWFGVTGAAEGEQIRKALCWLPSENRHGNEPSRHRSVRYRMFRTPVRKILTAQARRNIHPLCVVRSF